MNLMIDILNFLNFKTNGKKSVLWLSHHIPKTAGTSLKVSYERTFGSKAIKQVYAHEEVKRLGDGKSISLPMGTKIIHGHFHAHPEHMLIYPNAKRIVWIRDPVERAWSMLGHMLDVQKTKTEYKIILAEFGNQIEERKLEVFEFFLTHPMLKKMNQPYKNHFSKVPISEFDFVGRTNKFEHDIQLLSKMMGVKLPTIETNVRDAGNGLPQDRKYFEGLLEQEYSIVLPYLVKN
ncbi:sulfotransferase family 2 domain-containing protein [Paraglaciecola sp.]|uniref:sulfotransferase family 2 domain-containing protein n=1 Tax=Paraglaciecola sp. TaxID=1920173 RepID=UPI00273E8417|nr:sulfotransferase family 2 domain-containing protein [Paraglaciecola sp.]MDP5032815.1 sulfotransferase family protein [Paraglaciecola sp.]